MLFSPPRTPRVNPHASLTRELVDVVVASGGVAAGGQDVHGHPVGQVGDVAVEPMPT